MPCRIAIFGYILLLSGLVSAGASAQEIRNGSASPTPPPTTSVMPPATAVIDPTLAIGGQEVKAREVETRLSVAVEINGRGPYHFVVDSGADTSAIGINIAHDLQLPADTPVVLNGTTSRELVPRVKVDSLTLGATTIRNLELPALREGDIGGEGIIGIDALAQQRLLLDFDRHVIRIEDVRTPQRDLPGEIVIVARRRRGQLILTQVRAGGLPLSAVIDTGSEITIGNLALRDKLLRKHPDKFWTTSAIGVTGVPVKLELARIDELQLGPVTLQDVPIAFADVPPFELFGLARQPSLMLGTDVLQAFRRVSLDFRERKVRFQLRSCGPRNIVISTTPENSFTRVSSSGGSDVCGG
ncbi:MAG TPA: aspartyl protease family protein [Sphingomicrobium sp.]|nr:aspartyl protease family protein [Sphingomicrobium sp.]